MSTDYHAKFFANELSRNGGDGIERLGRALFDACVDLNPHQIEAALFALRSPISKGALLADEVGLGKTIEAGLVMCQYWAEKKRKILVICPASLRKQWAIELFEKFNLPSIVIDSRVYEEKKEKGAARPFDAAEIVITSMHYASAGHQEIRTIQWDLIVIDEAHKLRNAYRESNRIGQNIRWAIEGDNKKKLLLTATPLQNTLLELYGLSTLIDERLFGDLPSFRTQYVNYGGDIEGLRRRLQTFYTRSLRSQVQEYVNYTKRQAVTRPFKPTDQEQKLYNAVSEFLQDTESYALPKGQRHLLVMLVRKVLASSPPAVAGTLEVIKARLQRIKDEYIKNRTITERILQDAELDEDLLDTILEDEEDISTETSETEAVQPQREVKEETEIDIKRLEKEIEKLDDFIRWASGIGVDTKAKTLLSALEIGFKSMKDMGAQEKAVIFTESRRTQAYLKTYLEANGYSGRVLTFNGTNREDDSFKIYKAWSEKNKNTGRLSGTMNIDLRTAIIDTFKDSGTIMIATEAAAEGINLQFCSLVVNFDMPWNPQRIEQRIGRCHRYGQKYDVVVINFINEKNEADRRVYELLEHKFNLFSGVFGASDEVLGTIEAGMDFEKRVLEIYQNCRTEAEIKKAFDQLRKELDEQIQERMEDTKRKLLENFDADVHEKLKMNLNNARESIGKTERMFWETTKHILKPNATFYDKDFSFDLEKPPLPETKAGKYKLISKVRENVFGDFLYRLSHPLGEYVVAEGLKKECPYAEVEFDVTHLPVKISMVESLKGKSGYMILQKLAIESYDKQDYLLFSGFEENGTNIDMETCIKMFSCPGTVKQISNIKEQDREKLKADADRHVMAVIARNLEENNKHFMEERDKLEKWADDMVKSTEKELDDVKRQIKEQERKSRQAVTMDEQKLLQESIAALEKVKRSLRQRIFDVEDEIKGKRDALISALAERLKQKTKTENLFVIKWSVV